MGRQGKKRPREAGWEECPCGINGELRASLEPPPQLPPKEASAVGAALERWGRLRCRVDQLRTTLEQEDRLMQEILDGGLGCEDRKTLRKLASGAGEEATEEARQVAAALGSERDRLQEILMRNQRELLELSTSATTDHKKEDLLQEMDAVLDELRRAQDAVHSELLFAKDRQDMAAVRAAGRSLNELKALTKRLDGERKGLTKNAALASLLVTVCRRVLPVRQIDPSELREISPSYEGYLQILDFYFFSDASLYCFGEHYSGPNWFTRLKRNIAILMVRDSAERIVYNAFAVSGENKTPGAPPAPATGGPLVSIEAEDEHGRVFDRRHDAEFKLLTGFCLKVGDWEAAAQGSARAELWSKKPLCRSCAGAVRQVQSRYPRLRLEVIVGDPSAEATSSSSSSSSPWPPCLSCSSGLSAGARCLAFSTSDRCPGSVGSVTSSSTAAPPSSRGGSAAMASADTAATSAAAASPTSSSAHGGGGGGGDEGTAMVDGPLPAAAVVEAGGDHGGVQVEVAAAAVVAAGGAAASTAMAAAAGNRRAASDGGGGASGSSGGSTPPSAKRPATATAVSAGAAGE